MNIDTVNIKGTKNGLLIIVPEKLKIETAEAQIKTKIKDAGAFFTSAKFNIIAPGLDDDHLQRLITVCEEMSLVYVNKIHYPSNSKEESEIEIAASIISEKIPSGDTLLLIRSLRSGQTLQHDGNIVIVGDVNPGAEIVAGGNIVVLGKMRGIAHAGCSGKDDAYILAYRLQPTQLRISGKVSRSPEKEVIIDYPELAKISDNQIFIQKYKRNVR